MSKFEKLLLKILSGNADHNFPIEELKSLLLQLGFFERKGASLIKSGKSGISSSNISW